MLDVKKLLTKILNRLRPTVMFSMSYPESAQLTTNANTNADVSITATKSGWYPLGIVGYQCVYVSGSTAHINIFQVEITARSSGSCTIRVQARNTYSSQTKWKALVEVLWARV